MPASLDIEDHAALLRYLRASGHIEARETPSLRPLSGGVSNRVVLIERENGASWVLKQALEKLRVEVDWFSDPRRIHREALGLRHLSTLAPSGAITPLVFEDHEHHLLAMEAVPQPHQNWKTELLEGRIEDDHLRQFARLLSAIHRKSSERRPEFEKIFQEYSFFETLRLEPYYEYSATQQPQAAQFLRELIQSTRERRFALTHGDYSPKNILIHQNRLILLDHEVIHWGDPAFDIGFALAHLLGKAHHLKAHRADFAAAGQLFWKEYSAEYSYESMEEYSVRHTLGCLLARVAGRSRLEYLSGAERTRQSEVVFELLRARPESVNELIAQFTVRL